MSYRKSDLKFQDVVKFEYDKTSNMQFDVQLWFQDVVKFEYDKTRPKKGF